ncbi:MAG: FecR domain-containing protein [Tannerellaceae bacterium]|jgi:ferric-dicitrate binding protein FerR (iron transport regulator)|nr:FecR domain-containing protein [Tannerellaceae bacterium]
MIQKENSQVNTSLAWRRLYTRLEQDGLLPGETTGKAAKPPVSPATGWAIVAGILLCISIVTAVFLHNKYSDHSSGLLTLHNEEGAVTLVKTLEDGSIVYLADNTRLQYPEHFARKKREVILNGNALFDVAGNKERPFMIETELIRIEVTGTAFNIQSAGRLLFELTVKRGEVKVTYKKNGESLHVKEGETVTLSNNRLWVVQTGKDKQVTDTGRIRFKDETLGNILRVINKNESGLRLQTTSSLENRQLTATFNKESPETIAGLICAAFNLQWRKENNVLLIFEP